MVGEASCFEASHLRKMKLLIAVALSLIQSLKVLVGLVYFRFQRCLTRFPLRCGCRRVGMEGRHCSVALRIDRHTPLASKGIHI